MRVRVDARLTILPIVNVPVLSEHKMDMQPKVSIVARFLTRMLRFAMRLAMMVSDKATQTGRPCTTPVSEIQKDA
jgi:hypothetical protein